MWTDTTRRQHARKGPGLRIIATSASAIHSGDASGMHVRVPILGTLY